MLAVIVAAVCAITSLYQESLYVVSDRSLATSDFLSDAMPSRSTVIGGHYPDLVWRDGNWTFLQEEYFSVAPDPFGNITRGRATAMVFDNTTELWHRQWGTFKGIYKPYWDDRFNNSMVLDNGRYWIIYGEVSPA
jgi:hypothetical protein